MYFCNDTLTKPKNVSESVWVSGFRSYATFAYIIVEKSDTIVFTFCTYECNTYWMMWSIEQNKHSFMCLFQESSK